MPLPTQPGSKVAALLPVMMWVIASVQTYADDVIVFLHKSSSTSTLVLSICLLTGEVDLLSYSA